MEKRLQSIPYRDIRPEELLDLVKSTLELKVVPAENKVAALTFLLNKINYA